MTFNNLAEIFDAIDEMRSRLFTRLDGLTGEQERFRPTPDAWSIAEIAEHLAILEERLSKLFTIMITKAEASGARLSEGTPFRPVTLEEITERSLREKYTAPEAVRPTGTLAVADSVARLKHSREALHALRPRLETLDMTGATYPHPAFGPLDVYQWLALIGLHEGRHLRQIETLMAAPEFQKNVE